MLTYVSKKLLLNTYSYAIATSLNVECCNLFIGSNYGRAYAVCPYLAWLLVRSTVTVRPTR